MGKAVLSFPPPSPFSGPRRDPGERRAPPRGAAQPRIPGPGSSPLGGAAGRLRCSRNGAETPPHTRIHSPLRRPRPQAACYLALPSAETCPQQVISQSACKSIGGGFGCNFIFLLFPTYTYCIFETEWKKKKMSEADNLLPIGKHDKTRQIIWEGVSLDCLNWTA